VAYFKVISKHLHGDAEETYENLSQDSQSPAQNWKAELPKYKAELRTTRQQRAVTMPNQLSRYVS
jgi:hypothetical protein